MQNILVDNAKVMAKGQITLPKDIREALGGRTGDRVTLIRRAVPASVPAEAFFKAVTLPHGAVVCDYSLDEMRRFFNRKLPNNIPDYRVSSQ